MKLIIQIPCYNEADTLKQVINELPKTITGIDIIEYLVINDGSEDNTATIAKEVGAHHLINISPNRGLSNAFIIGIEYALKHGADLIVNTDGDNQYCGNDIERLIRPILVSDHDIVIGCRNISEIEHFSSLKKILQKFGTWIVNKFLSTEIPDTTTGFRAYNREAALRLYITNSFSYTLETLIQSAHIPSLKISHITVKTNPPTRASRLCKSMLHYVFQQAAIILRCFFHYAPLKYFILFSISFFFVGIILGLLYLRNQSIVLPILSTIMIIHGIIFIVAGIISQYYMLGRKIMMENLYLHKKDFYQKNNKRI